VSEAAVIELKELFERTTALGHFPDELLQSLKTASTKVHYDADDKILRQGEVNGNLFFLMLGTVDVYVDDGLVASLKRRGDMIGEMSVITNRPCSATLVAQTPVELLKIDTEQFRHLTKDQNQFEHILYRIYALILTDKLHVTNQKAKKLEETLEALEKAKGELQQINKTMEVRVAERTAGLKNRMEALITNHLQPLKDAVTQTMASVPEDKKGLLKTSVNAISGAIRSLDPIMQSFSTELSIKNKAVLVADAVKKHQLTAKMALGGTGVKLSVVSALDEGLELIENQKFDIVLADIDHLPLLPKALQKNPRCQVVFVTSAPLQQYVNELKRLNLMPNIVTRDEEDRALTIKNIMTTVAKLAVQNAFGIERYLNWGVDIQELQVMRSVDRDELKSKMTDYFVELGVRKSIIDHIVIVAEELLMNAIYDAPVDAAGRQMFNALPRTQPVELRPHQYGFFRFATDGTYAAISVEDPFGALTADTVLKYLESCYGGTAGELNRALGKGGAGRGLHQIIENSTLVVFNVKPGQRTEVIALFHIIPGEKRERPPQFHYFTA
jgi:CRP-like cAMP-binding protein